MSMYLSNNPLTNKHVKILQISTFFHSPHRGEPASIMMSIQWAMICRRILPVSSAIGRSFAYISTNQMQAAGGRLIQLSAAMIRFQITAIYRAHKGRIEGEYVGILQRLSQPTRLPTSHFPQIGGKLAPRENTMHEMRSFFKTLLEFAPFSLHLIQKRSGQLPLFVVHCHFSKGCDNY